MAPRLHATEKLFFCLELWAQAQVNRMQSSTPQAASRIERTQANPPHFRMQGDGFVSRAELQRLLERAGSRLSHAQQQLERRLGAPEIRRQANAHQSR